MKDLYKKWSDLELSFGNLISNGKGDSYYQKVYLPSTCPTSVYIGIEKYKKSIYIAFDPSDLNGYKCLTLQGMEINVTNNITLDPSKSYIKLINISEVEDEVFCAFSSSLVDSLTNVKTKIEVFTKLEEVIKYYSNYFKSLNNKLSEGEEQGLCGELTQLSYFIDLYGEDCVNNWTGPYKNKRDFVFENFSLEVKTTKTQTNPYISISNEQQLDINYPKDMEKLYLKVFVMEKSDIGFTLVDLSNKILSKITNTVNKRNFLSKIIMLGINLAVYEPGYRFTIQDKKFYEVTKDFPSITAEKVDKGIYFVKYKITLSSITNFEKGEQYE